MGTVVTGIPHQKEQEYSMNRNSLVLKKHQRSEIETLKFLPNIVNSTVQPFVGDDCSAGMEYELQVAVEGTHSDVDLPITIKNSTYYRNVVKRAERGDLSSTVVEGLKSYLYDNTSNIWENSWVRLKEVYLSQYSREVLRQDFLADKEDSARGVRKDIKRFQCNYRNKEYLRLPISYLLKLSLADIISKDDGFSAECRDTGEKLLNNLVSDNTSPEILSFTIPRAHQKSIGDLAAEETARTYLMNQLLVQYANREFGLLDSGQKCLLYFAPHAPSRQKRLNDLVPDGFYRHLFMSPCLSGWARGEEKHKYMEVCHKTLSRSQLNTIGKLKDAGILTNNLVTLPNTSNTCLANNGTHVSLGSTLLTKLASENELGFTPEVEKYIGDLSIKIIEHFLPLLVGNYSSAPYRIDFEDFHPENVLGFLPHELDYTHLRMVWRRWKKKARNTVFGRAVTPFGPRWLDTFISSVFRLKGDVVPDFRLIDYLVSLLSTDTSPSLNGMRGNHDKLKQELMEMGVFDTRMSIYLLYRQRIYAQSGYAGFEGRSYSLFHSLLEDMAEAVDMQNLITALAYRYILEEKITHKDIPDTPSVESERRQIFFVSAIDLPTFFVRSHSSNAFLTKVLEYVPTIRKSNRYRNYLRVKNRDYRLALIRIIREDGKDLIEKLNMDQRLARLEERLMGRTASAHENIMGDVTKKLPHNKKPLQVTAEVFNATFEEYCRVELKKKHTQEGLTVLANNCKYLEEKYPGYFNQISICSKGQKVTDFLAQYHEAIIEETASPETIRTFMHICLHVVHYYSNNS